MMNTFATNITITYESNALHSRAMTHPPSESILQRVFAQTRRQLDAKILTKSKWKSLENTLQAVMLAALSCQHPPLFTKHSFVSISALRNYEITSVVTYNLT